MSLTVGSLFSGIGGIDLGLERTGHTVAWQVERDPFCRKVLAKHWPHVPCYEDIHDVGAHNLAPVDLIAGGFPCQDISYAGKGAGIHGARSGLWWEYARVIRELEPRYVLVENVAALLVRGMGDVLGTLASLGYDATWDCIPAGAFGAPYARDRVFVLAFKSNSIDDCASRECAGFWQAPITSRDNRPILSAERGEGAYSRWRSRSTGTWWETSDEPGLCRVANGVPNRLGQLRGYGNAVVPQVAEWIGRRLTER